jgi:hypothetical protein
LPKPDTGSALRPLLTTSLGDKINSADESHAYPSTLNAFPLEILFDLTSKKEIFFENIELNLTTFRGESREIIKKFPARLYITRIGQNSWLVHVHSFC